MLRDYFGNQLCAILNLMWLYNCVVTEKIKSDSYTPCITYMYVAMTHSKHMDKGHLSKNFCIICESALKKVLSKSCKMIHLNERGFKDQMYKKAEVQFSIANLMDYI